MAIKPLLVFWMLLYTPAEHPMPVTGNTIPEMIKEGGSAMRKSLRPPRVFCSPHGYARKMADSVVSVCRSNLIC